MPVDPSKMIKAGAWRQEKPKPHIQDLCYIRGALRTRLYVNEEDVMELPEEAT